MYVSESACVCVCQLTVLSFVCQSDKGNILYKDALNILFTVMLKRLMVYIPLQNTRIQIVRDKTCCYHFMGYSF